MYPQVNIVLIFYKENRCRRVRKYEGVTETYVELCADHVKIFLHP